MNISIIGLGGIAEVYYLPILNLHENVNLQVYARTRTSVQKAAAKWKINSSAYSLSDVIRSKPDAAFVLTNSDSHYEIVKELLRNSIDVYVEKPATLHLEQSMELSDLAAANACICMVGFNRRFAPIHQRGKEYWGSRNIELAEFTKLRTKPFHDFARNHLYDDTIHLLDTMRYYCGEVELAHRELRVDGQLITAMGVFKLASGGIAIVKNSMRCGQWSENYILTGDGLTMGIDPFAKLTIYQGDEQRSWRENYQAGSNPLVGRGFAGEIDHFFECVTKRQQPVTNLSDSIKTQQLVEALAGEEDQ